MQTVVLATGNAGKLQELQFLLQGLPVMLRAQSEFAVPEAEETGLSFAENALLKARNAAHYTGLPALADDSGLTVDALHGAPGIYSARYAGSGASDQSNRDKLLTAMKTLPEAERSARFHCALVYLRYPDDPVPLICQASWPGHIAVEARGEHGFGYDPVFIPAGQALTAAELDPAEKQRLSHRGQAMRQLRQALQSVL
ncbi:MAG: RdgB/HAM1 family non-canonical purine NTP pyrophosphatase [Candidatus Competibacteraceae bacterium]|nr:RdgB/HAM1 family non-canonical purine NTP pyrophosphatase [Candidatus Competibacteraceae bacterium]MCB1814377.1 RdgB/HAM1 family non-canonical purine NTP pyrophosphatase [Candidatus Competibacteraceae bacterium]